MHAGILGYGAYIPKFRIRSEDVREAWGALSVPGVRERAFPAFDEDVITMAVAAGRQALERAEVPGEEIRSLYLATTSGPYDEKPNVSTVATALSGSSRLRVTEVTGTPRAGTAALLAAWEFVSVHQAPAMVVASDSPLAHPSTGLEQAFGAAAAAFVLGAGEGTTVLEACVSLSSESFGQRFRRRGQRFVQDLELRQDDYSSFVTDALEHLMGSAGIRPDEIRGVALHDADGVSAQRVLGRMGFSPSLPASLTPRVGDAGAAGALLAFAHLLDESTVGDRILLASYGAGSDATAWRVGSGMKPARGRPPMVEDLLREARYVPYVTYLKMKRLLSPETRD
jgi:hydroxymethylglutaryl-CoA synthase